MKKVGPRQQRRNQQYLQQAQASLREEMKRKEESEKREIDAARFAGRSRGSTVSSSSPSCLDVGVDFGRDNGGGGFAKDPVLCDGPAITYWASQLPHDDKSRQHFPSKSCSFTNDIRDGRLHHEDAVDFLARKE